MPQSPPGPKPGGLPRASVSWEDDSDSHYSLWQVKDGALTEATRDATQQAQRRSERDAAQTAAGREELETIRREWQSLYEETKQQVQAGPLQPVSEGAPATEPKLPRASHSSGSDDADQQRLAQAYPALGPSAARGEAQAPAPVAQAPPATARHDASGPKPEYTRSAPEAQPRHGARRRSKWACCSGRACPTTQLLAPAAPGCAAAIRPPVQPLCLCALILMWRRVQMSAAGPAPSRGAEEGSASKAEAGKAAEGSEVLDKEALAWRNRRDAV